MEFLLNQHSTYAYTGYRPLKPQQPTVVFIHGAGMDHSVWQLPARWFAHHGFNCLALDLPGHGRSAGTALASVEALADWVMAVLDQFGLEQASLVGHSMGSLVALDAANRYPQRIERIALLGSSAPMPVGKALLDAAQADHPDAIAMINGWGHGRRAHLGGVQPIPGLWLLGFGSALLHKAQPGVIFTDLNACNAYQPQQWPTCPALLLLGERDLMTPPKAGKALAARLSQAQVQLLPCGHMLMAEAPDAVLDALSSFIAQGRSA